MEASVFHPVLTDAGAGRTFSMLGATVRLMATAAEIGRGYTVLDDSRPTGRIGATVWVDSAAAGSLNTESKSLRLL